MYSCRCHCTLHSVPGQLGWLKCRKQITPWGSNKYTSIYTGYDFLWNFPAFWSLFFKASGSVERQISFLKLDMRWKKMLHKCFIKINMLLNCRGLLLYPGMSWSILVAYLAITRNILFNCVHKNLSIMILHHAKWGIQWERCWPKVFNITEATFEESK